MFNRTKLLFALIALLAIVHVEARADPLVIDNVSGFLNISTFSGSGPPTLLRTPTFVFSGSGLTVATLGTVFSGGDVGNVQARDTCLNTFCGPGTMLGTNSSFSGIIGAPQDVIATVNGVTYPPVTLTGSLNFVSQPIVLPDFGGGIGEVTIPFSMSGDLTGELPGGGTPIFTATLNGHGFAHFIFFEISHDLSHPHYVIANIEYQFEPVPEPGTLLLAASGLAALIGISRRRSWRK